MNGVVTAEYRYDANVNRTMVIAEGDTTNATYDDQDLMLTHGDASYIYGKRGDLQQKIVGTYTTRYDYDKMGNLRFLVLPDGTLIEDMIDSQFLSVSKRSLRVGF